MSPSIGKPWLHALLGGKVQPLRVEGYHPKLDSAIWPGIWNPDWDKRFEELYGYDPARAKELLEEAGYKNGFEFTMYLYTLPGLPEIIDIGQAIALDWQAVGLRPKLVEHRLSQGAGAVSDQDHSWGGVALASLRPGPRGHPQHL